MKQIDNKISEQLELIKTKITKNNFNILCEFNLTELDDLKRESEILNKVRGIYLFEIHNPEFIEFNDWIKDFTVTFRGIDNKYLQKWTPNIVKKRIKKHSGKKMEWIPLYIGKSINIADRINQHINSTLGRPPSALKLIARGNLSDEKFRIKYIEIDVINYDIIVSETEKALRDEINPISGK